MMCRSYPAYLVLAALFAVLTVSSALADSQFKMVTLHHRLAHELLPIIEPLVGEEGSVRAIDQHLLITASPERLMQVEEIIANLDVARRNVRITVSRSVGMLEQQRGGSIRGNVTVDDAAMGLSKSYKRNGVELEVHDAEHLHHGARGEFVTVLEGESAYVSTGHIVPFTEQWLVWVRRYAVIHQVTDYKEIATGFAVSPRYSGDQVILEITPRISSLNRSGYIDFEELNTVVTVRPGEWFDLGGTMQARDEVSRAILSVMAGSSQQNSVLRIRVD